MIIITMESYSSVRERRTMWISSSWLNSFTKLRALFTMSHVLKWLCPSSGNSRILSLKLLIWLPWLAGRLLVFFKFSRQTQAFKRLISSVINEQYNVFMTLVLIGKIILLLASHLSLDLITTRISIEIVGPW